MSMTHMIRAIYENGVFRPLDTPDLPDHQQVHLTVESISSSTESTSVPDMIDPLAGVRMSTGISDLAGHFDDYRFGRQRP